MPKPERKLERGHGNVEQAMRNLRAAEICVARVEAQMNAEIERVMAKALKEAEGYFATRESCRLALEAWWKANPPESGAKSMRLQYGKIGTRKGKASVRMLLPEGEVIGRLGTSHPQYVNRPPLELDQNKILREKFQLADVLAIDPGQDEFFATPDLEELKAPEAA